MDKTLLDSYILDLRHAIDTGHYRTAAQCAACLLIDLAEAANVSPLQILKAYLELNRD